MRWNGSCLCFKHKVTDGCVCVLSSCLKVERLRAVPVWSPVLLPVHRVCQCDRSPSRQIQTVAESLLLLWVRSATLHSLCHCRPWTPHRDSRCTVYSGNVFFLPQHVREMTSWLVVFVYRCHFQDGDISRSSAFLFYDLVWKRHRLRHRSPVRTRVFRQKVRCLLLRTCHNVVYWGFNSYILTAILYNLF